MSSTAGVCPNISTVAQTQYTRDPEDEWGPTDTELYEENNGYRGPGRPHGAYDISMGSDMSSIMDIRHPNPRHTTYSCESSTLILH